MGPFVCIRSVFFSDFWDVKQKRKVKSLLETFDVVSLRLKLASTLYCSGYLTAAQYVMHDVRRLYNQYLIQAGRTRPVVIYEDCSKYACSTYADKSTSLTEGNVSLILRFYSYESYSVPPVLLYEMNNSVIESELGASGTCKQQCHNTVSVDEHAFMYYLQYLTSAEVHSNSSQNTVLFEFDMYLTANYKKISHRATAINLLGHCYEMEGCVCVASALYVWSLTYKSEKNPAIWHINRFQQEKNCSKDQIHRHTRTI